MRLQWGKVWRRIVDSDVSATMIGTVIGQAVIIIGAPILTRLYSPSELGGFAVFMGLAGTISVVAPLGFHLAIPLPQNRRVAANIVALSMAAVGSSSVLVAIGGLAWRWLDSSPPLSNWLWLLGPVVAAICGFQVIFYWCAREGAFRKAGMARLLQALAQVVGQIGAGTLRLGTAGLIVAYTAAQFVGVGRLWQGASFPLRSISGRRIVAVARRYRKFPQFTMWGSLANAAGTQLPAVVVGSLFGLSVAGQFALALRVLALPATLLGRAIAQVFFPRAAAVVAEPAALRRLVDRATGLLLLTSITCFLPIIMLGGALFAAVFGSEWHEAGEYGSWIALWSAVALVSSPVSTIYLVAERQEAGLMFSVADALAKTIALLVGGWAGGPALSIKAFAITSAVSYLAFHAWTLSLVGANLWGWIRPYLRVCAAAGIVVVGLAATGDRIPAIASWVASTAVLALICWPSAHRLLLSGQASR